MNSLNYIQEKIYPILKRLPASQKERLMRFITDPSNIQNMGLWMAAVVAGFVSVAYAKLFRIADEAFSTLLASPYGHWSFLFTPFVFILAWYIVRKYAPEASGSGIPQIMAANELEYRDQNCPRVDRLLSLKTSGIKILSSLLCVVGGGAIGREGPTLQISTSIFHFFGKKVRQFVPDSKEQTWVVAGAAAGLASAFNTPLGGIVYAIEELGVVHFHRIRTALVSGVIISGLVAQWLLGSYLFLGFPQLQEINLSFLPVILLCGIVTGYMGGLFGHFLFKFATIRHKTTNVKVLFGATIASGLAMAVLFHLNPHAAGSGITTITGFLFGNEQSGPTLIAVRFFGTMVSYLSGAAGGIFSPSLAIGATIGSWIAAIFNTEHSNLMVLLGMIGFLTGVTRTPFTAFILVLEMTDRHSAIFPMMMVALSAQWAAHLVDTESFYGHIKRRFME